MSVCTGKQFVCLFYSFIHLGIGDCLISKTNTTIFFKFNFLIVRLLWKSFHNFQNDLPYSKFLADETMLMTWVCGGAVSLT